MEKTKTLPIAIYNFISYAEVDWGGVMAAAVAIMAPATILTMIFQKYVVKGLTMGRQGLRIMRTRQLRATGSATRPLPCPLRRTGLDRDLVRMPRTFTRLDGPDE
jgi:hypothetical protein